MTLSIAQILTLTVVLPVAIRTLPAAAEDILAGPVQASVIRTVDGDTLEVQAHLWPGLEFASRVRVRGIDAPELHSACAAERAMAEKARERLALLAGDDIQLQHIANDKYGGRVDADVVNASGADLGAAMIAAGLVRPYDGGQRGDWCPVGSITRTE